MESFEALRDDELEVAVEIALDPEPEPELELDVIDDLDDAWFASDPTAEVYEIDPVHPLRRLSAWVRGLAA